MTVRAEHGFSLIELLVAMALSVVVFGATLTVLDVFQSNNRTDQLRNETQDNARSAIDRLARELRNVVAKTTGSFGALEQAGPYSLTFETVDTSRAPKGNNTTDAMRVRYCVNNTNPDNEILWRQIKRWESEAAPELPTATSCPDPSSSDWESSTQLVQHITNQSAGQSRSVFLYGPPSATEPSQIISVEPNLFIDPAPGRRPGETQLTSAVSLRNANRQPIAMFTVTKKLGPLGETKVKFDASESRDPDGLALSYKWWDGSKVLPSTAQQFETELATGPHILKLEVTDPGGLSNSFAKEVTI